MPTLSFNYSHISPRVRQILQAAFGPNAAVRTDEGTAGHIYVRLISDRFDGLDEHAKQNLIWEALRRELQEEAQAVSLVLAFGTDQI